MAAKLITPTLSVSPQVQPQDIAALAAAGFRSVICNRPDGEGPDQPAFVEIEAMAKAAGLAAAYQPIIGGRLGMADAMSFAALTDSLPKPVLAYCRSGTRSATLWSLSEAARGRPLTDIMAATMVAGYDMSGVLVPLMSRGGADVPPQTPVPKAG